MQLNNKNKFKRGQSVVEFMFVILLFLNLLVVTFNAVMGFAVQQYVSYAAFMAARAFQAGQETPAMQLAYAERTLRNYLYFPGSTDGILKFPGYDKVLASDIEIILPSGNLPPYGQIQPIEGAKVEVRFKVPLFQLPFLGLTPDLVWVPLRAVSYLGREPTREECRQFFRSFFNFYNRGGPDIWRGMFDNKC